MSLAAIHMSRLGRSRKVNQDRCGAFTLRTTGLYVVADGMGGHFAGEKASETVLADIKSWWDSYLTAPQRPGFFQAVEQLKACLEQSNGKIRAFTPQGTWCGTTVVLLWIQQGQYAILSAGDSRCYAAWRRLPWKTELIQLTTDDVAGKDGPGGAKDAGKLVKAVGIKPQLSPAVQTGEVPRKAVFLLCSDGVYRFCPHNEMEEELRKAYAGEELQATGNAIMQRVEGRAASDDHTLVLVRT